MATIKDLISRERLQYLVFLGLTIAVMALTGIITFTDSQPFVRFIGGINPVLAALTIIILGGSLLTFILSRGWFVIYKKKNLKGVYLSSGLAAVLGSIMILIDFKSVLFPSGINTVFPASLCFYPAIGFFVEILFHLLPLTLLLIMLTSSCRSVRHENILWISVFVQACVLPVLAYWLGIFPFISAVLT